MRCRDERMTKVNVSVSLLIGKNLAEQKQLYVALMP
jgi:hypothetical protein